jgi:hypothetical protein
MLVKQISIFIENRSGRLLAVTEILAQNKINIRALSIADTASFGILHLVVDNTSEAERVLRENSYTVSINSMISAKISDKPGGLVGVLDVLAKNGLSVEYIYAFISNDDPNQAAVFMRIVDDVRAVAVLKAAGYSGVDELN